MGALDRSNAWRATVHGVQKSRDIRLAQPRTSQKADDVADGTLKFNHAIRDYLRAGGVRPNGKELENDPLDTIRHEVGEQPMRRAAAEEPSTACFQKGGAMPSMWVQWPDRGDWDSMEIEDLEIVSAGR